jgi:protein TonB
MTSLLDSNSNHDLDHTSDLSSMYESPTRPKSAPEARRAKSAPEAHGASANEVYGQVPDTFEPDDGATLMCSMAASSSAHVLLALPLFIYGSFLVLQPERAPRPTDGPKPIPATFIFIKSQTSPEPPQQVAKVTPPEEKKVEPPKPKLEKRARRVTKKAPRTAPRSARTVEKTTPVVAEPTPLYVAPASELAKGPLAPLVETKDSTLPSGPATSPVALEVSEKTAGEFDREGVLAAYKKKLSRAMKKDYNYPRAARRAGIEGRTIVRFLIDARGNVLSVELASSSGHEILDNAALEAARSVKHVPAAPDSLQWGERHIKVPFKFRSA